ncbi:MAG: aminopeptidase P family protein [Rhizobiaceae bacterium]|nr:aminopeptidase P family protein [Rhizobiaceae bacterium]
MNVAVKQGTGTPFDHGRVDRLMDEAGIDILFATSKHNVQYLLGGYRFIFFSAMDAIGHSRYLPVVVYQRGRPENSAYVANKMEGGEHANNPFWPPSVHTAAWGSVDAARIAVDHVRKLGVTKPRIGIEPSFLPADAYQLLVDALGREALVDATGMLERMRALKTPEELEKLRLASEKITESMLATFAASREGSTKGDIVQRLRREETARELQFEYCLITVGASHNRAVSPQAWRRGEVLSIDSGGNYLGYIGDLCRMGVLGEPDAELKDLLAEVDSVQQAAFSKVRAGMRGGDMIAHAESALKASPSAAFTDFFAHGMGLISHEVPFLMTNHPVAYEGVDGDRPLEANMVLSIETTMLHPKRGFIKLEDTVAVTDSGYVMFGEQGRGWNLGG